MRLFQYRVFVSDSLSEYVLDYAHELIMDVCIILYWRQPIHTQLNIFQYLRVHLFRLSSLLRSFIFSESNLPIPFTRASQSTPWTFSFFNLSRKHSETIHMKNYEWKHSNIVFQCRRLTWITNLSVRSASLESESFVGIYFLTALRPFHRQIDSSKYISQIVCPLFYFRLIPKRLSKRRYHPSSEPIHYTYSMKNQKTTDSVHIRTAEVSFEIREVLNLIVTNCVRRRKESFILVSIRILEADVGRIVTDGRLFLSYYFVHDGERRTRMKSSWILSFYSFDDGRARRRR